MAISSYINEVMNSKGSGVIRKMFEEGIKLKAIYGEDKVFDFSLGNPDLDVSEEILQTVEKLSKVREKNFHGYMPNAGYTFTREAIAKRISNEQEVGVDSSCVVMSVGAAGALNCVFKALLNPGDEVIVPAPFFAEYRHYVNNFGGKLVEVKTKADFSLDVDAIKNALSSKTAAVLINSPNNPTGRVYSQDEIISLAKVLNEHGKNNRLPFLICDEPYREIIYDEKKVALSFAHYSNAIVVSSFAKNFSLPGERLGYICVNPACPEKNDVVAACIFTTRILGFVNAPAFFQRVIAECWNVKPDYSLYLKRRNELMDVLNAAGIEYTVPEGAFYMWCKVPESFGSNDDMEFCDYLKKYLILAAPGSGFGGKGYFRLAYCVSESSILNSRDAFMNAMKDLNK